MSEPECNIFKGILYNEPTFSLFIRLLFDGIFSLNYFQDIGECAQKK